jgi:hypothetical protein
MICAEAMILGRDSTRSRSIARTLASVTTEGHPPDGGCGGPHHQLVIAIVKASTIK